MTISVNGENVELVKGTTFDISDSNIIFGFDNITCQRTSNIDIPATANNLRLLELDNDFHSYGTMERKRYNAVASEGVVAIAGYLYIVSYNNDAATFSACFVGGSLTDLIGLKGRKIADVIKNETLFAETTEWTDYAHSINCGTHLSRTLPFASVKRLPMDTQRPSISFTSLLSAVSDGLNIPIDTSIQYPNQYPRLEMPSVQGISEPYIGQIIESQTANAQPTSINLSAMADGGASVLADETTWLDFQFAGFDQTYEVHCYRALAPIKITIASLPVSSHTYAFIRGDDVQAGAYRYAGFIVNGYNNVRVGDVCEFETGDVFCLVDTNYFHNDTSMRGYESAAYNINATAIVESLHELSVGDMVRLKDNLPDWNVIDLLKYAAVLYGRILYYSEGNGFQFIDPIASTPQVVKEIGDDVLRVTMQQRTIADYAQHNIVEFNHDGAKINKVQVDYVINNENIEKTKMLQTIPISEGGYYAQGFNAYVWVSEEIKTPVLYQITTAADAASVRLIKSTTLEQLFYEATEITIEKPMTLLEYVDLHETDQIFWRNAKFYWREKRWKNGICTLILVKI